VNDRGASKLLPRRGVRFREAARQLALHLPARPRRLWTRFGSFLLLWIGLLIFVVHISRGWLLVAVGMGALAAIILSVGFASLADLYLTDTFVLIAANEVVVKKVLYGRKSTKQYKLATLSRARQWYARQRRPGTHALPRGIEIGLAPYDAELGSDWRDESLPRFGDGLSPGELDLVEWRINQFLDRTQNAARGSAERERTVAFRGKASALDEVPRRPPDTGICIETHPSQVRIVWPNTVATRSFSGIGILLFGLAMLTTAGLLLEHWRRGGMFKEAASGEFIMAGSVGGAFGLLGLAIVLKGLSTLLGRRELVITSKKITYRTALFGISLRQTLRTAEVISVGLPQPQPQGKLPVGIAPARGCVIRTAEKEVRYGVNMRAAEMSWLMSEVADAIHATRAGVPASRARPVQSPTMDVGKNP
jgi:hypothetical protein